MREFNLLSLVHHRCPVERDDALVVIAAAQQHGRRLVQLETKNEEFPSSYNFKVFSCTSKCDRIFTTGLTSKKEHLNCNGKTLPART